MTKSLTLLILLGVVLLTACQSQPSRAVTRATPTAATEIIEITPDTTPEVTPEITPDVTPELTPEMTAEVTREATAEITPDAALDATPEMTLQVVPGASAEVSPEVLIGDAVRGETLFTTRATDTVPACSSCHTTVRGGLPRGGAIAPSLIGVANRAGERIEGLSAEEYLYQSIVAPRSYLVDGFADNMYTRYASVFSEQELADLVAFLMTLE
jgi:cytochrome c2